MRAVPSNALFRGVDEQLDLRRARERLLRLIAELPQLDRQLILLHLEDVAQSEIAAVTGLSMANVSTRLGRIKTNLTEGMNP